MKNPETTPFVVGRIAKDGRRLLVLTPTTPAPIPGPWDLRAVFAA
jgi:hypothetical protein